LPPQKSSENLEDTNKKVYFAKSKKITNEEKTSILATIKQTNT
jgi:hypothetical protein